jgi:inhibitor of KinA
MPELPDHTVFPLGDSALTIDFGNRMDEAVNRKVLALFRSLQERPLKGVIEAVPAYSSITLYYDMVSAVKLHPGSKTAFEIMAEKMEQRLQEPITEDNSVSTLLKIPVCYQGKYGLDIEQLAATRNILPEDVIRIHTAKTYTVYMLGFLPGFSYMGNVDDDIAMPRRTNPRPRVEAGSVGIAGHQTGIYPLASPGGWQIIGRTPAKLFDSEKKELTLLKPGDRVQFYSISTDEFNSH